MIQVDREVQDTYRARLGLRYALWSHTIKNTSTQFCRNRSGRIYTYEEVKGWDSLDWPGKIPGVSVVVSGHGYNCRANISWMTETAALALSERIGKPINSYN